MVRIFSRRLVVSTSGNITKCDDIISLIKSQANPKAHAGMMKFGINTINTYGTSIPALRALLMLP
jgi:hypothetical protein